MSTPERWTVLVKPFTVGAKDRFGNPVDAWGTAVTKAVYGWAPAGTDEVNGWRHVVTADLEVYASPTFTCGPRDKVTVLGQDYEVEGEVEDFNHGPFGYEPGVRVNLRLAKAVA